MRRFALGAILAWIFAASTAAAAATHYDLKAVIEPAGGSVSVRGEIAVPVEPGQKEFSFILHRTFAISRLTVDGRKAVFSYQDIEPTAFNPATRQVVVMLPAGAAQDSVAHLSIAYAGVLEKIPEWGSVPDQKLAMDDQVNSRLVQLASYSSWYPQYGAFGGRFRSDLQVSLPKGWIAVSGGARRDMPSRDRRAVTHWSVEDNFDLVITAAPDFKLVKAPGAAIEIYHTQMPDALVAREAKELSAVMTLFSDRLGESPVPGGVLRHVYAPMKRGQGRAGIARAGIIVTSEGRVLEALAKNPGYTLFQDIAHEIAHFWWNFGAAQGDWIDEAFAEYFSALAVRDLVSPQEFETVLERYRQKVQGLPADAPSLATVPREGGNFVVRYYKGSLMLDEVRQTIGDETFLRAARDFYQTYKGRQIGTAEFRAFWGARLGDKRSRLDAWIDQGGGLPQP